MPPAVARRTATIALAAAAVTVLAALPMAAGAEEPPTFAVRTPAGAPELVSAIRDGWFFRWVLPRLGTAVEVGPNAAGAVPITAAPWPLPPSLVPMVAELPVGDDDGVLRFAGGRYPGRDAALAVRLPAAAPAYLVTGYRPEAIAEAVNQVLAWLAGGGSRRSGEPADYLVRENPWLERRGSWRRQGERWGVDPAADRDGFAARDRWFAGLEPIAGARITLLVPPGEAERADYLRLAADLDRAVAAMAPRLPVAPESPVAPILVAVETDFPSQARHTGSIGEAVPGGPADLHLVYHPDDLFAYRHALAALLIARSPALTGLPPWLARGAALWLSGDWYGRPWTAWLPVLTAADLLPSAQEMLASREQDDGSPPLWTPAAAALVEALRGDTLAAKLGRIPGRPAVAALMARIEREALRAGSAAPVARVAGADPATDGAAARSGAGTASRASLTTRSPQIPFLRGVSFAMLNRLDGGYHAPAVDRQLERLAALGADAVSLMPFAYQRDPRRPTLAFLNRRPESETDVGTVHAARRARARGLSVLWKPHLWISWESWPGEVAMASEADWTAWWRGYRRFILHHALLAAWSGSELFSVGVELDATLGRQTEWRRLIADVRRLYPGLVTYAGNWDKTAEVGFWDALDLVGVDAYHPLAASPEAGPDELARGARRVAEELAAAARRAGRPVLLTEVGFAARRGAWVEPHGEGGEVSEADQAAAYRALFTALDRPPWLAGTFLWKAFSGPTDGGGRGPRADFRFLGRAAEAEVRRYFAGE